MRAWMRSVLGLALATAALAGTARAAATDEVERFLPSTTFLYGGVEKLGPGFDRIVKLIETNVPMGEKPIGLEMLRELAEELNLPEGQIQTPEQFAAMTGLDPEGSAGIAWVLAAPAFGIERSPNENVLLVLPVKDAATLEPLLLKVTKETMRETPRLCRATLRGIEQAKRRLAQLRKDGKLPDGPS